MRPVHYFKETRDNSSNSNLLLGWEPDFVAEGVERKDR